MFGPFTDEKEAITGSSKLAGHCSAVELLVVGPLGAGAVESYPAA